MIPAFLTIVLMPFTYSITNGIGAGFISYVVLQAARGRARDGAPAALGHRGAVRRSTSRWSRCRSCSASAESGLQPRTRR